VPRDYRREYLAAVERARQRGFESLREQRRTPRLLRGSEDFAALPENARASRSAASAAIARSRESGLPLELTGAMESVDVATIRYWFPKAVRPTRRRKTRPTRADRYVRLRPIAVEGDLRFVTTRGSRIASDAMRAFGVQWDFVHGRASADDLVRYAGRRVGGFRVETDPAVLERLAAAGQFRIEEIYRELVG